MNTDLVSMARSAQDFVGTRQVVDRFLQLHNLAIQERSISEWQLVSWTTAPRIDPGSAFAKFMPPAGDVCFHTGFTYAECLREALKIISERQAPKASNDKLDFEWRNIDISKL